MSHGNPIVSTAERPVEVMPVNMGTVPSRADSTPINIIVGAPSTLEIEKLRDDNWFAWKTRISIVLRRYDALGVAAGSVKKPEDPEGAATWNSRDLIAQQLITTSIKDEQVVHVSECKTSAEMWSKLWDVHEPKGQQLHIFTEKKLYCTRASEGADIVEHIMEMKRLRNRLSLAGCAIEENKFKLILLSSLPQSWEEFTASFRVYQGRANEHAIILSTQELVFILSEEYRRRKEANDVSEIGGASQRKNRGNRAYRR